MSLNIRIENKEKPTFNYPFATAPDIIRAYQKDVYFQEITFDYLSTLLRRLKGAHILHTYISLVRAFSELFYFGLTTLIGNQTLGEEYCNIVQIEDKTLKLPSFARRLGYVLTSSLAPLIINKILPRFRTKLRAKLESKLQKLNFDEQKSRRERRILSFFLENLSAITSPSPIHVITLTVFYFSGAYYELSKRMLGLRYIFTKRIAPSEARVGYEVLGVLLVLQISVQAWHHIQSTLLAISSGSDSEKEADVISDMRENSQENVIHSELNPSAPKKVTIKSKTIDIKVPVKTRYDLQIPSLMPWLKGQNRKCTLCLETMKDPSVATCGHVFCWICIGDWIKEKPECPLCRRGIQIQHVLPLKA